MLNLRVCSALVQQRSQEVFESGFPLLTFHAGAGVRARPLQAALASAGGFAVGAAMPLLVAAMAPAGVLIPLVSGTSLVFLALLGGLAARPGGAAVMLGAAQCASRFGARLPWR